jgi:hypothetical protein
VSSTHAQLSLARAVTAQPRARLLSPDNTADAPVLLTAAVESGRGYFVVPRPDLLVVDADLPADPEQAAARAAAFDQLIETADGCGVAHVVVASGRPGHRHAYLLIGTGRPRMMAEQWCRSRGLDLRDRGVRPPGAPHRDGRHRAVPLSPTEPEDVIAVLRSGVDADAANRLARRLMPVALPARIRSALRHGHGAAGYESPSHARMALAVAIRSRQGPKSLLELLLGDPTSPLGATYRARPGRWQHQELGRLWDKAGTWLVDRPAHNRAAAEVDRWAAAVAGHRWSGMAGGTDLAIAEALTAIGRRAGTTAVGAALNDLAVAAGVSLDTARTSVRRLIRDRWLAVVAEATPRTSRVYRMQIPADAEAAEPEPAGSPSRAELAGHGDLGADLARWRALGKVSMRVARTLLGGGPLTVPELAQTLRMRPAALRYHLRKLFGHNLVAHLAGGRWSAIFTAAEASNLETNLGVAGQREQQRADVVQLRARRSSLLRGYRLAWLAGRRAGRHPQEITPPLLTS